MADAQEITQHFHAQIPISQALGIQVLEASSQRAVISAPLRPNINHVKTVFGGSLYSAAALACYALFQAITRENAGANNNLVIQEGRIRYIAPVDDDFTVEAELVNHGDSQTFIEALHRQGKARLALKATVFCRNKACAEFEGTYVFNGKKSPPAK